MCFLNLLNFVIEFDKAVSRIVRATNVADLLPKRSQHIFILGLWESKALSVTNQKNGVIPLGTRDNIFHKVYGNYFFLRRHDE